MKSVSPFNNRALNPFIADIFYEIFSFVTLDIKFILNCRLVCTQWNNMILNFSNLWNNVEVYVRDLQKSLVQLNYVLTRIKCNFSMTDNDLRHITHFVNLQQLNLSFCKNISFYGLQHLIKLSSLQKLNLKGCRITNKGLQNLFKLTSLRQLNLSNCDITDMGLQHLMKL